MDGAWTTPRSKKYNYISWKSSNESALNNRWNWSAWIAARCSSAPRPATLMEFWPSGKIFSSLRVLGWLLRRACAGLLAVKF